MSALVFIGALMIGACGGLVVHAIQWHLRLRTALRFIKSRGVCQARDLPVEFPHLTASKLGERNWVCDSWTYGRLELTPTGEKVIQ